MPLKINIEEKSPGMYVIRSAGSIDATTSPVLLAEVDAVIAKHPKRIIFDMKDVGFVSSAGIGVVLAAEKSLNAHGGSVLMVNLQPQIRKVFDIVQALPSQQIFSSVEEMDRYLKEIQRKVTEGEL
jgi:anti-sigma B factor antagonist